MGREFCARINSHTLYAMLKKQNPSSKFNSKPHYSSQPMDQTPKFLLFLNLFAAHFKLCAFFALCSQNASVCRCLCVCVHVHACVCVCVCVYALRIVSMDKILHFTNTLIIHHYYYH